MSAYIHHIPGRLRVRTDKLRYATCQFAELEVLLMQLNGIESCQMNQKTGSLLVHYDPSCLTGDDILYQLHKVGCLESGLTTALSQRSAANHTGALLGNALFGAVVKKSLETSMLSFAKAFL
ncbi:HMA2 domain-containing protein [Beggiatoa leptomitoformis]|uniref:Cation transporter n=1 Tax=Beggiatoa leptomitoformis TaxID=288004 RepID=A0A2N9YA15_9GAMM|nr:hypothetical protein [Beggiatoa leptomitoformis]ALG67279.1 hypothetical protein AL038_05630 [Beggiatoa leptomitoformis]AUI67294.1 hypothetical protein BLE401_00345 [Beggiatoa leptomitoformis]